MIPKLRLGSSDLWVPNVAVGCMRLGGKTLSETETFLKTALELGLNFFDHADIYGGGCCEERFAAALPMGEDLRERVVLQSKCGIRSGRYDFSKAHILSSVEGSLRRLRTEYLDLLLLHRPDALCEPEEVAEAFATLQESGKVRHFGVSNHTPLQIALLQKALPQPLLVNQMQFSLTNCSMIDAGMNANNVNRFAIDYDGGVLDYCRLQQITLQAWSPFQFGFFDGVFIDHPDFPELNRCLQEVADAHGVTKTAIAVAWIARHPAKIQTVTGTTNPDRLRQCALGAAVQLSREEWYALYCSAGKTIL